MKRKHPNLASLTAASLIGMAFVFAIDSSADESRYLTGLKLFKLPDKHKVVRVDRPETQLTEEKVRPVSLKERARFRSNLRKGKITSMKVKKKTVKAPERVVKPMLFDWDGPRNLFRKR